MVGFVVTSGGGGGSWHVPLPYLISLNPSWNRGAMMYDTLNSTNCFLGRVGEAELI